LVPAAWHHVERYANNRIEADHGRLKNRIRPIRGIRTDRTAQVITSGLAFMQNLRRGHHELATEIPRPLRVAAAFTELAQAISRLGSASVCHRSGNATEPPEKRTGTLQTRTSRRTWQPGSRGSGHTGLCGWPRMVAARSA
jgi:hypothetical protein